jgi:hypothetical protein
MGFLKKLLGGDRPEQPYVDKDGIYLYVQCDRCGTAVRLRADKQYDLVNEEGGFVWHKTIVDNRCFRPMPTVVRFNRDYEVVAEEITGGHYITEAEYQEWLSARSKAAASPDEPVTP